MSEIYKSPPRALQGYGALRYEPSTLTSFRQFFLRQPKVNYRIRTDAIKENIIPPELSSQQIQIVYTSEADFLNVALFGETKKDPVQHWALIFPVNKSDLDRVELAEFTQICHISVPKFVSETFFYMGEFPS